MRPRLSPQHFKVFNVWSMGYTLTLPQTLAVIFGVGGVRPVPLRWIAFENVRPTQRNDGMLLTTPSGLV